MSKKFALSPSNEIQADLLFWVKQYLAFKLQSLFEDSQSNTIDDIIDLRDSILNANNIEAAKKVCNEAIRNNLKSLTKVLGGSTRFYNFAIEYTTSIKNIQDQTMLDFEEWMKLAPSTKKNYVDIATELTTYIQKSNKEGHDFNISYETVRTKKQGKKQRDAMDSEQFKMFNKEIEKYPFKNELTKARDILAIRFILLCGLKPREVVSLEFGKDLIFKNKDLYLHNRKNRYDLPRKHFIRPLNKYIELKEDNYKGYFFYDLEDARENLSVKYIQNLIERLLEYTGIKTREADSEMLRTSLAVYLYNNRSENKQISLNTIQELLGFDRVSKARDMVGFHADSLVKVTDVFEKDLEID